MQNKFNYIRSKKLMALYRTIPCQSCGVDDGTVCGAHSNQAKHGKGRGIKASDIYCASLCVRCHRILDVSVMSRQFKEDMWNLAHRKTMLLLADEINELIEEPL